MSFFGSLFSYAINNTKRYDLRAFVLFSFLLQSLLLVAAPFRKSTSNRKFLCVVWLAYLFSDWCSNFAVGLIPPSPKNVVGPDNILMLWAPFLLLHIGGADSIAALSSSDTLLWSRFAIQLATMIYGLTNAFYRWFEGSRLQGPVMLMFIAGFSRFIERILCLSQARFSSLKESLLEERKKSGSSKLRSSDLNHERSQLSDARMLSHANRLFESFKALFVDLNVDSKDRKRSREYFLGRDPSEAFKVVETELNFTYDIFYTKFPVIRHGLGRFLHPVSVVCEVTALVLWFRIGKGDFKKLDVLVTYALLLGALARDFISFLMVAFSDWTLANIARKSNIGSKLVNVWLSFRKRRWDKYSSYKEAPFLISLSRVLFRRWSESIPQQNLIIDVCLRSTDHRSERREKNYEELGIDFVLNKLRSLPKEWFTNDLRDFIFRELKERAGTSTRGVRVDQELVRLSSTWIGQKTFDESLLLWHIATTLCNLTEEDQESLCCKLSVVLSAYMMYLLLRRPEMVLEVAAMGDMRYEATRSKAKSLIHPFARECNEEDDERFVRLVCQGPLNEISDQDKGYSVLSGACRLARELKELKERREVEMWEVIAKVWVEMLSYAAARCSPSAHVAELANGGELLTLVRLIMEHLSLGK